MMRPHAENKALIKTFTVANGATASDTIDLEGFPLMGFIFPSALTSTTMSFKTSNTEFGTFVPINDDTGSLVSITVAASKAVGLTPTLMARLAAFRYLRLEMGSAEGGARSIHIALRG